MRQDEMNDDDVSTVPVSIVYLQKAELAEVLLQPSFHVLTVLTVPRMHSFREALSFNFTAARTPHLQPLVLVLVGQCNMPDSHSLTQDDRGNEQTHGALDVTDFLWSKLDEPSPPFESKPR